VVLNTIIPNPHRMRDCSTQAVEYKGVYLFFHSGANGYLFDRCLLSSRSHYLIYNLVTIKFSLHSCHNSNSSSLFVHNNLDIHYIFRLRQLLENNYRLERLQIYGVSLAMWPEINNIMRRLGKCLINVMPGHRDV
jgi:hypothetical protein